VKYIKLFEEFLVERQINEIGEGVTPFAWRKTGYGKVESWMSEMSMYDKASSIKWYQFEQPLTFEFKSDKTTYTVKIVGEFKYHQYINFGRKPGAGKPHEYDIVIGIAFDTAGSEKEVITNFGEQFKVISTVSAILEDVVKRIQEIQWVKLQEIIIAPKLEDDEDGKPIAQSKRGRLYLEYIKKQGAKLEGNWTADIKKDRFIIKRGKWSGGNNLIEL
jgi:hypothetical protein